jgi:hypothetical protein
LPASDERRDDADDERVLVWLHRSRREQMEQVRLSDTAPPALIWEEMLRKEPYWRGTLEEAREAEGTVLARHPGRGERKGWGSGKKAAGIQHRPAQPIEGRRRAA